jgi:hypothetical protein
MIGGCLRRLERVVSGWPDAALCNVCCRVVAGER